ncbi:hypothetical protein Zmor_007741 [Zophobas morio]|uniref:glutathione transferase n=1 Tax=Zophobas morio TaxID=2755281 RepID=A0AA38IXD8_9CUCU|nr:hypothetical protein Zmor_007741 [Zophobas morio]
MAPAYKLIYGDYRGLGETSRFLFKYGGIEFEDARVQFEDWPQWKEKTPFGQFPLLEHNGKQINQSIAIARYLANLVKLAGNDDWENLEIDSIVDTISDIRQKLVPIGREQDQTKRKALIDTLIKESFSYHLPRLVKKIMVIWHLVG